MRAPVAASSTLVLVLVLAGCQSTQSTIHQQREKLESLAASTRMLADDWLAGQLPPRYTRTAFDALYRQVEQQRSALAATPAALADARGATLSQQAEQLSRAIAVMEEDVARADAAALRARLSTLPLAERP